MVRQALILAGGRGSRLGSLTDACPKPLLPVSGRPFLEFLLAYLRKRGVEKVILSIGHRAEIFQDTLPEGDFNGLQLRHSIESEPAGTGGAVGLARDRLDEVFFVLNGDTIFDIDCQELSQALVDEPSALAALALREVDDAGRYGSVTVHQGLVRSFTEKSSRTHGVINGGIYCLRKAALARLPRPPCSLEKDLFPALAASGALLGRVFDGYFIDIGLAETLARAQVELPAWQAQFGRRSPSC